MRHLEHIVMEGCKKVSCRHWVRSFRLRRKCQLRRVWGQSPRNPWTRNQVTVTSLYTGQWGEPVALPEWICFSSQPALWHELGCGTGDDRENTWEHAVGNWASAVPGAKKWPQQNQSSVWRLPEAKFSQRSHLQSITGLQVLHYRNQTIIPIPMEHTSTGTVITFR